MSKYKKMILGLLILGLIGMMSSVNAKTIVKHLHIESEPKGVELFEEMEKAFEKLNPDIDVQYSFLENEAFKNKIPTLLQSKDRPHVFQSWGGGNFQQRVQDGLLEDITPYASGIKQNISSGAIEAFTYKGKLYGYLIM